MRWCGWAPRTVAGSAIERSEIDLDALWRHTLAVALLTEAVCNADPAFGEVRTMGFTVGILHVVGRLVLASQHPRRHSRAVRLARRGMPILVAELSQFGVDHAAFGGGVAIAWGLPDVIASAIAAQNVGGEPLAEALHRARLLAWDMGIGDGVVSAPLTALDFSAETAVPLRLVGGPAALQRRIE